MPRFFASAAASVSEPSDEKRDGMATPSTFSGPSARAAMQATSAESMPPDRPSSAR